MFIFEKEKWTESTLIEYLLCFGLGTYRHCQVYTLPHQVILTTQLHMQETKQKEKEM